MKVRCARRQSRKLLPLSPAEIAALLLVAMLIFSPRAGAEEAPEILPVNPVPDFEASASLTGEETFDGIGVIDRLEEDDIVIDDIGLRISFRVDYYIEPDTVASRQHFKIGSRVGYQLDEEGEVYRLWLLTDQTP